MYIWPFSVHCIHDPFYHFCTENISGDMPTRAKPVVNTASRQVQGVSLQYLFFYIPAKNGPGGPHAFKGAPGCVDPSGHHPGVFSEYEHQSKHALSTSLLQSTGPMLTSHLGGGALIGLFKISIKLFFYFFL